MATVVVSDAHSDDEVVRTGGALARTVAVGHRVVVDMATNGRAATTTTPAWLNHG